MENITTSDAYFDANLNMPDFVQKLTADSLTQGNVSAGIESYRAMPGTSRAMSMSPVSSGSQGISRSVSLPTHVMEPPPNPPPVSPGVKPKIKTGNSSYYSQSLGGGGAMNPSVSEHVKADRYSAGMMGFNFLFMNQVAAIDLSGQGNMSCDEISNDVAF